MTEQSNRVLAEGVRFQCRLIGESLELLRQTFETRFDSVDRRLTRLEERVDAVYFMTAKNTEAIVVLQARMSAVEARLTALEDEMRLMRSHLVGKVDREEFTGLEKRVGTLETRRN